MKLENALKQFNPKSQMITNVPPATSSDSLSGPDLAACLGMAESQASFGMAAFLGKNGISKEDGQRTIERLAAYAMQNAGKHVGKAAGRRMAHCMVILAKMAYAEYCQSAGSTSTCTDCAGTGFQHVERDIVKYAGHIGADGEVKIPAVTEIQAVRELCQTCNGKGQISARCRCNGTGRVRDLVKSNRLGVPVDKTCDRCTGRGFKRMPSSTAYAAITALLPELTQSSWSRNWKSLYELLVVKCEKEESHADAVFQRITRR